MRERAIPDAPKAPVTKAMGLDTVTKAMGFERKFPKAPAYARRLRDFFWVCGGNGVSEAVLPRYLVTCYKKKVVGFLRGNHFLEPF